MTGFRSWRRTSLCSSRGRGRPAAAGVRGYVPGRLHQRELSIAVLAADLTRPEIASMPFFGSMH